MEPAPIIILHLDLNAFFAAVEERHHPEYAGKPVIVGADPKAGSGRGVVATCNYAARKFGVHSAMPISKAYRLCPQGIFTPVNYKLYAETSQRVMQILRTHTDAIEQVSIDEAFLDVSQTGSYAAAKTLAQTIKDDIKTKEGLACSVGIGPNKLIAKVASDFQKPDGLTVVPQEKAIEFLAPQDISVLRGVGPKTKTILNQLGINTVQDVHRFTREQLVQTLGSFGESIYWQARGEGSTHLVEEWQAKSIGRQRTFEHDTKDTKRVRELLDAMIQDVHEQIRSEKLRFKTITVKVRYDDFDTKTKQRNLIDHLDNIEALRNTAFSLLQPFLSDTRNIRLVGVSVRDFKPEAV
jgi:DNA polymerase IV (DinB-like DNA polymerase)